MPIVGLVCGVGWMASRSTTGTKGSTMSKSRKRFFWEALYALVLVLLCGCVRTEERGEDMSVGRAVNPVEARSQRTRIAAGAYHTLAVSAAGEIWAWGVNDRGQLGNGTIVSSSIPVEIQTPAGQYVIAVAAGHSHSIALTSGGSVLAWGDNLHLQLGNPQFPGEFGSLPQPVPLLGGVTAVAASTHHSIALTADGRVWSWGSNVNGQLGDCTTANRAQPVTVKTALNSDLTNVIAIAAGSAHSMALTADGDVYTWGGNSFGQLGDGTLNGRACALAIPSGIQGTSAKAVDVAAGHVHSMALMSNGDIYSWGQNTYGQLGHGTFTQSAVPAKVESVSDAKAIGAGYFHSFAVKASGSAVAWGYNYYGQLGEGNSGTVSTYPVSVNGITGVMAVAGGLRHSVAVAASTSEAASPHNGVWTWGSNTVGQGGQGQSSGYSTPSPVSTSDLPGVIQAVAGMGHSLALTSDGRIFAWGRNKHGQLGLGYNDDNAHPTPAPVSVDQQGGLSCAYPFIAIAAGDDHSVALCADGSVWTWGFNLYGQLGDGSQDTRLTPVQVLRKTNGLPLTKIVAIAAGAQHSLALHESGEIYAWGLNQHGQLGTGSIVDGNKAEKVISSHRFVSISAGVHHSVAVSNEGKAFAWGERAGGRLCDDGAGDAAEESPAQIMGLLGVVTVRAGAQHTLILRSNGKIKACGNNSWGQLGDGDYDDRGTPGPDVDVLPVVDISAGGDSSLALAQNGSVLGWGSNEYGQLGFPPPGPGTPDPTSINIDYVVSMAIGPNHSVAVKADGTVYAWGYNNKGQLGDGTTTNRSTPVPVSLVLDPP